MGNDGGSIPDRRDLVRTKAKAEQADKANQTKAKWFFCALSKRKLQEPVVSCALGKLYNKDAILEFLLDRSTYGDGERICGHVRSLKDVKTLKLTPNTASLPASTSAESTERAQFVCPLNLKEMNGVQPFVYLSTCGCTFSHAGLKSVASSLSSNSGSNSPKEGDDAASPQTILELCPQCAKKYSKDDIVLLNPSEDEELTLRHALEKKRLEEPTKKKSKKRKHDAEGEADADAPTKKSSKSSSKTIAASNVPSINAAIVGSSRAVVSELALEEAKRKANMSEAVKSLYGDGKAKKKETFMTMGTFTRYA